MRGLSPHGFLCNLAGQMCIRDRALREEVREPDFVFRLSGDAFVAVFHSSGRYACLLYTSFRLVMEEGRLTVKTVS